MKKMIITLGIIILLALVGCDEDKEKGTTGTSYIGGTDSVSMEFMEEAPPDEVYDQGQFPFEVGLELTNKGEYRVDKEDILVTITGIYPEEFSTPESKKHPEENLGKRYLDSEGNKVKGTTTFVTFEGYNFKDKLNTNNPYTIRANLCYGYGTRVETDICILKDITSFEDDKYCNPNEKKSLEVSSAPVQIKNFEESVVGENKLTFSFEIVHNEEGRVFEPESGCTDNIENKNKVFIDVKTGLKGLSCSGLEEDNTGYVSLHGNSRLIRCKQEVSMKNDFNKKVEIELKYDYKKFKEKEILVKHTGE